MGGLGCATPPAHVPAHIRVLAAVMNLGVPGEGMLRGLHGSLGGEQGRAQARPALTARWRALEKPARNTRRRARSHPSCAGFGDRRPPAPAPRALEEGGRGARVRPAGHQQGESGGAGHAGPAARLTHGRCVTFLSRDPRLRS